MLQRLKCRMQDLHAVEPCVHESPVISARLGLVQVTGKLNAVERGLLATRVAKLRATLDPALTIQNWHSLGILDFVASVNKVLRPLSTTCLPCGICSKQNAC